MLRAPLLTSWSSWERGVYCFRVLFWRQTKASEFSTSQKCPPRECSTQCLMGNTGSLKKRKCGSGALLGYMLPKFTFWWWSSRYRDLYWVTVASGCTFLNIGHPNPRQSQTSFHCAKNWALEKDLLVSLITELLTLNLFWLGWDQLSTLT